MGLSPSKRAENTLKNSSSFKEAIITSYQECLALTQHAFPGLRLYQLPHACSRIHSLLSFDAAKLPQNFLSNPPTQLQIDQTLRHQNLLSKNWLNLEDFNVFSLALFRDVALSNACRSMAWYIPMGLLTILCSHMTAIRLPKIGPRFKSPNRRKAAPYLGGHFMEVVDAENGVSR